MRSEPWKFFCSRAANLTNSNHVNIILAGLDPTARNTDLLLNAFSVVSQNIKFRIRMTYITVSFCLMLPSKFINYE